MAILVQSNKKPSVSFPSQTGSIVTFNSQYAGLPLKSCKVNIPVTQEGTGDPSPDNMRNFVGVSSLDFTANSVVKTFQFGQTIYAGELDVLTGIFTATHKIVDLGDLSWNKLAISSAFAFVSNAISDMQAVGNVTTIDSLCSSYPLYMRGNGSVMIDKSYRLGGTYGGTRRITIRDDDYTSVSDFKSAVTGVQVFYPLATPEVINLGGMNIETLQGENNLFASTGETTASHIKIGG